MTMVLGGAFLLASAASISIYKENEGQVNAVCGSELMVTIVFSKNAEQSPFEMLDHKGNHFLPVLQSNESVLSKTGRAKICYSHIEKSDNGPGRIFINKVDYLPLSNEGK